MNSKIVEDQMDDLDLDLQQHELMAGMSLELPSDLRERVVVVLSGTCALRFEHSGLHRSGLGSRSDIFNGSATAIYAPRNNTCVILAETDFRFAVASARALNDRDPYFILPDQVTTEQRGRGAFRREVHNIVRPEHPADSLLIGETFSTGDGVWSGYPPHKHDRFDPPNENRLVEKFLIQVRPKTGFGVLLHYQATDGSEHASVVHDGDIISVNEGFHSFVGAAGHGFYYLWAIAGKQRLLLPQTDPRHAWILDQGDFVGIRS